MTTSASDLGPFTGLRLLHHTPTVELFTGFEHNGRRPVVLLALTEQAGADPNWSAEFTDAVAKDATTLGPLDIPVHVSDLYGRRPWAASLIAPGRRSAERILAALPGSVPEGTDPSAMFAPILHPGTAPPRTPAEPVRNTEPIPAVSPPPGFPLPAPAPAQPAARPQIPGSPQVGAPYSPGAADQPAAGRQIAGTPQHGAPGQPTTAPQIAGTPQHGAPGQPTTAPQPSAATDQGAPAQQTAGPLPTGLPSQPTAGQRIPGAPAAPAQPGAGPQSGIPGPAAAGPQGVGFPASGIPGPPAAGGPAAAGPQGVGFPQSGIPGEQPGGPQPVGTPAVAGQPMGSPDGRPSGVPANGQAAPGSPAAIAQAAIRSSTGQHPILPASAGTPVAMSAPQAALQSNTGQHPILPAPLGTPGAQAAIRSNTGQHPILPSAPPGGPAQGPLPPGAHNPTVPLPPGSPGRPSAPGQRQWIPPRRPGAPTGQPRRNNRGLLLTLGAAAVAVLVLVCGLGAVLISTKNGKSDKKASAAPPAAAPNNSNAPTRTPPPAAAGRPTFKSDVLPVVVAGGVVFADSEQTETVDELPLPFAFRTPKAWSCSPTAVLGGRSSDGYACQPSNRAEQQQLVVAVRRCDDGCTAEDQSALSEIWFDRVWHRAPDPRRRDSTTVSAEDPGTTSGTYHLVLSHFFADQPGQPLRWQVVVNASAPAKKQVDVQKVTNDIRSQTPA